LLLNLLAFRQKCDFGDNAQPVLIRYFVLWNVPAILLSQNGLVDN
jgi:hypothetical protein